MNTLMGDNRDEGVQDPRYLIPMAERRNVNSRYPLFNREYKAYWDRSKRFPVAKRSTNAVTKKRQVTDPKVHIKPLQLLFPSARVLKATLRSPGRRRLRVTVWHQKHGRVESHS